MRPSTRSTSQAASLLPLRPADFHILMVLLRQNLHGYGLMQEVEHDSDGMVRLEVGSLYRLIARMSDLGLLEEAPEPPGEQAERRRYYRITALGREVAALEARRLVGVVRLARARRLLQSASPG